jgi:perosamine synthetase
MIPVYDPWIGEEEAEAVKQAVLAGEISGSFGKSIPRFEESFAARIGCRHGVAVTSGTTALHLAVAACHFAPGDEILLSSSTNIATALAIANNGLVPVPVDSEPDSWNLNPALMEELITPRTRAVMPVHLFGRAVDMAGVDAVAQKYGLKVIEDCAESHGATWRGQVTGTFGDLSCFSFYANKILTTGEGGMVLTNDDVLAEELRLLRNLAFTIPRFRHEKAGFNFRMTGYQAAMGLVQMGRFEEILRRKRRIAQLYHDGLSDLSSLVLPREPEGSVHVHWVYGLVLGDDFPLGRDDLMKWLKSRGVDSRAFFHPMNLQPCLQNVPGFKSRPCPVAEKIGARGLYLPSGPLLTDAQVAEVCARLREAAKL